MTFEQDLKELAQKALKGDKRALARVISFCEDRPDLSGVILSVLYPLAGKAKVVGITGSPGAGKSTLVNELVIAARKSGARVAVIAVDPTSPFTGGAVLGDRIRMLKASEDGDVYIRSLASRGSLGGLSRAAFDVVTVLDAVGYEYIFIETVGVGQGEVDIVHLADCSIVVLVPGMGDAIQTIKAGILEIADIFVINKADHEGVDRIEKDLLAMLTLAGPVASTQEGWKIKILRAIATAGTGSEEILKAIQAFFASTSSAKKKSAIINIQLERILIDAIKAELVAKKAGEISKAVADCIARKTDPYTAAKRLLT